MLVLLVSLVMWVGPYRLRQVWCVMKVLAVCEVRASHKQPDLRRRRPVSWYGTGIRNAGLVMVGSPTSKYL